MTADSPFPQPVALLAVTGEPPRPKGQLPQLLCEATESGKAHRTATSMAAKKGWCARLIGRTKGGMTTKLHAICDGKGRPLNLFVTAGPVSDYIGTRALLGTLPKVDWLLVDRGYDADWFRDALKDRGIRACIPGRQQRKTPVKYDNRRYKRRNPIEIMFGIRLHRFQRL